VKRAVLLVLGVLVLLLGLALVAAGGGVAALLGQKESISTQPARMSGAGVALVAEHIRVDESNVPIPQGVGTFTLTVTAPDGRQMFAGTAAPDDLDGYLTGAPYDVVVDLASGGKATTRPVPGTQQPAPPAGQPFWIVQSSGTTAAISSDLEPGTALVVMNSDATPGVTADVVVTYRVRGAWTAAWIAVGAGVVLILLSFLFFWRARVARRRRDARRAEAAAAAAPAAPISATTVLPTEAPAAPAVPEVPAWAAAPVALSGAELAGPPTGGLVVERSADGAEAVVSASEPPPAAPPEPEAGWYPGAAPAAAAAAAAAAVVVGAEQQADVETAATAAGDGDDEVAEAVPADDVAPDEVPQDEAAGEQAAPGPQASDDAVDTWHDETRPVPVVAPGASGSVEVAPAADGAASDTAVYDELASWFRDEPGTAPGGDERG
jgi:hypothetical protein